MKKFVLLSAVLALSACACMDSDEEVQEPVVYKTAQPKDMNCDYFDGKTCYRYVRRTRQIAAPAPVVRYREVARPCPQMQYVQAPVAVAAPAPVAAPCAVASCAADNCCGPKISETREPVEITYKKTTYTTVYEPKTSASVSYEKAPYTAAQNVQVVQPQVQVVQPAVQTVTQPQVQVIQPQPVSVVKTVAEPQPQITVSVQDKPAEYVEYDSDEDILLNVK